MTRSNLRLHWRIFLVFFFAASQAADGGQEDARIRQGPWGHIAFTAEHSFPFMKPLPEAHSHLISLSELISNGPKISALIMDRYGFLRRVNFNCESGEISIGSRMEDYINEALPTIQRKLCGVTVYPLARLARYLWSDAGLDGKSRRTAYWIPSESYRSADSIIFKSYIVENWDSPQVNLADTQRFVVEEINCRDAKTRSQWLDSPRSAPVVNDSLTWEKFDPNSIASAVRSRLCADSSILATPESIKAGNAPAQAGTAAGIESAKKKCIELGFKQGTEKFGECVLTLSK